jgi:hypothetical protein
MSCSSSLDEIVLPSEDELQHIDQREKVQPSLDLWEKHLSKYEYKTLRQQSMLDDWMHREEMIKLERLIQEAMVKEFETDDQVHWLDAKRMMREAKDACACRGHISFQCIVVFKNRVLNKPL